MKITLDECAATHRMSLLRAECAAPSADKDSSKSTRCRCGDFLAGVRHLMPKFCTDDELSELQVLQFGLAVLQIISCQVPYEVP